jgi:ferrochelatase
MKKGVVLLNMGGVSSLDEIELFLTNMFNDINIIGIKNSFIRSIVAKIIVTSRKETAKKNYQLIKGKSPLVDISQSLIKLLNQHSDVFFTMAMRYLPPFANNAIDKLQKNKIEHLVLLPLYPQYSTTTTKSSLDDFVDNMKKANYSPNKIEIINRFYNKDSFIELICNNIKSDIDNAQDWDLVFSAHSLPQKIIDKGDSYQDEIIDNIKLIKNKLSKNGLEFKTISLAYQSKLGPIKWLEPSLETILKTKKTKKVIIYPLSFIIDNSETVLELDIEYRALANKIGIEEYKVVKCPNDSKNFIDFILSLI